MIPSVVRVLFQALDTVIFMLEEVVKREVDVDAECVHKQEEGVDVPLVFYLREEVHANVKVDTVRRSAT